MIALSVTSPSTNLLAVGASVPIGQSGIVTIRGRNDISVDQKMGISWVIKDPDGIVVEEYSRWEMFATAPGDEQAFIGGRFDLAKEGAYTIKADLLMNPDSPVIVDSYEGDLCTTTPEVPPEYELIQHTISHFAYIYDGDVEVTTATFKIDPFTPSAWAAQKFADALESEAREKGARVLETKVYVDTTPLLWTNIRIEVTGTPLGEEIGTVAGRGIAVGIAPWLAIVLVCLAIVAVIVVATLAFKTVMEAFKKKPGLEDVKPAWGKEALILDIQDAEEHWERTPTPVETLEGMSEEELRDKLDQIAEEEVPPEAVPWAVLALVGGLGILGVGAAVALAARPKE
ncbi:hypothetical protein ES705_03376 [subsurface metagenome]